MRFENISLNDLEIGPGQLRRNVRGGLEELEDSIRVNGVLHPIIVIESPKTGKFTIISGHRRFLAAQTLGLSTIPAQIMEETDLPEGFSDSVDWETLIALISLTESFGGRELATQDLIDMCTALYHNYGSLEDVSKATGLPLRRAREYVKFPQLCPELKEMVEQGSINLNVALRAQQAAQLRSNPFDPAEAIAFATAFNTITARQQRDVLKELERNPDQDVETVIERVSKAPLTVNLNLTLGPSISTILDKYAKDHGMEPSDAIVEFIVKCLEEAGYE